MSAVILRNVDRLNKVLFGDALVKPVKAAGVWVMSKHPLTQVPHVLMGEMVKTNPQKPETHMFDKTYGGFSGKAKADEEPIDTAVREFQEETFGLFGTDSEMLALIASDTTQVMKNMGWMRYPVATYIVEVDFSDDYLKRFDELRSSDSELQRLKWVPLSLIWRAIDTFEIKGTGMFWGEYNSAANLGKLFGPLNGVYSGLDLELQKNALKYNLPVVASDGTTIEVADYVARTFMEYRDELQRLYPDPQDSLE